MRFRFVSDDLGELYTNVAFDGGYGRPVARAFRKVMQWVVGAVDERDFYSMRSLHFEKLKGDRSHQHSMRLNDQWRLIVEIETSDPKNVLVIINIEDYHR